MPTVDWLREWYGFSDFTCFVYLCGGLAYTGGGAYRNCGDIAAVGAGADDETILSDYMMINRFNEKLIEQVRSMLQAIYPPKKIEQYMNFMDRTNSETIVPQKFFKVHNHECRIP